MGGRSRYRVPIFDAEYRVIVDNGDEAKPTVLALSESFTEAEHLYDAAVRERPGEPIQMLHRARVIRDSRRR